MPWHSRSGHRTAIINADFEVTLYAKGLLEYASEVTSSYLSNARPNPATGRVNFIARVTDEDYRLERRRPERSTRRA